VFEGQGLHGFVACCAAAAIFLNLQSKGTLDRAFLGSTAERVVRLARIPVLSIPLAQAPEEERSGERAVDASIDG
jgi:hypothetical protein